ncbi:MAG: hypothetical protein LBF67_00035 [Prevotellaceae bacterium]|jgi:hypothetical protein|nr:hypothetical protein [Prevotellaceae bacterium]
MKSSTKNTKHKFEIYDTTHAASRKNSSKIIYSGEPVPINLMENPDSAKAKQWKNSDDMPSDFWL